VTEKIALPRSEPWETVGLYTLKKYSSTLLSVDLPALSWRIRSWESAWAEPGSAARQFTGVHWQTVLTSHSRAGTTAAGGAYVHSLKELETALQFPPHVESADIVPGRDAPYFTFWGLVRLCRDVLLTFLNRQEYVEKEPDYPWRSEVPGTIHARLAPQYWIWQDANCTPPQAKAWLAGLIEHLVYSPNAPPDMRKVLERIEANSSTVQALKTSD
jgi:hypothetical protein